MWPALADIVLIFYLGASQTSPSDLHVVQQALQNDATVRSVTWRGFPFRFEIYYGLRLMYTQPNHPWSRIAIDYTHYKVYADTDAVVVQDGTWHGQTFTQNAPMRKRVQSIEMTHGLNMLGISLLQQVAGSTTGGVYVGGGPVIFLPHTESRVDGLPHTSGYQYGGSGVQYLAGVRGCAGSSQLLGEIKYSTGAPVESIADGSAQTVLHTVHELLGVQFGHCPS
jgi:hypothetical protein